MSTALLTRGFISERVTEVVTTSDALVLVGVDVREDGLDLTFNMPPVVTNPAPEAWLIITPKDGLPGPAVTSVSVLNSTLYINTGEHHPDERYRLTIPPGSLTTALGGPFVGIHTVAYAGLGTAPVIMSIVSEDEYHILVTYSEPVEEVGMLTLSNYSVNPRLTLSGIVKVDVNQVRLTTARQTSGVMYQLTVKNVRDLGGNLLTLST